MVMFPLSVLALAAGVYLLIKVNREYLGGLFSLLAWLVILLSLVSIGVCGVRAVHHWRHMHMAHCNDGTCTMDKQTMIKNDGKGECCNKGGGNCPMMMNGCKMEGDSVVMDKEECTMMMGKDACDKMMNERGRCIMSKEECEKMCHNGNHCKMDGMGGMAGKDSMPACCMKHQK